MVAPLTPKPMLTHGGKKEEKSESSRREWSQVMEECEYFYANEADPVMLQVLYEYTLALCNDICLVP